MQKSGGPPQAAGPKSRDAGVLVSQGFAVLIMAISADIYTYVEGSPEPAQLIGHFEISIERPGYRGLYSCCVRV